MTLKRFQKLRPPISSTMSTGPMPVATSIVTARISSDDAPATYCGLNTRSSSGANTARPRYIGQAISISHAVATW